MLPKFRSFLMQVSAKSKSRKASHFVFIVSSQLHTKNFQIKIIKQVWKWSTVFKFIECPFTIYNNQLLGRSRATVPLFILAATKSRKLFWQVDAIIGWPGRPGRLGRLRDLIWAAMVRILSWIEKASNSCNYTVNISQCWYIMVN